MIETTAERSTYRTSDGHQLATYEWAPTGEPKAMLQVVHGMAEHAGRYDHVAAAFNDAGYLVHAHDHRGHGDSIAGAEGPGHIGDANGWNRLVLDIHERAELMAEEHPDLPRVIFAHSMGGYLAQDLLGRHPGDADAWAISGNAGQPPFIAKLGRLIARFERKRVGPRGTSTVLRKLTFDDFNKSFGGRTEADWLSRDEAQVDRYVADPLCGFDVSVETWLQLLDAIPRLTTDEHLGGIPQGKPVYILAGSEDTSIGRAQGARNLAAAYGRAGLTDVTVQIWPGGRHEMVNETNREQVIAALVEWADAALARATGS